MEGMLSSLSSWDQISRGKSTKQALLLSSQSTQATSSHFSSLPPSLFSSRLMTPVSSSALPPSEHLRILSSYLLPSPTLTLYPLNVPQPSIRSATVLGLSCYLGKSDFVKALLGEGPGWGSEIGGSRKKTKKTEGRGKGWVSVDGKDGKDGTGLMCESSRVERASDLELIVRSLVLFSSDAARDGHLEIAQVLVSISDFQVGSSSRSDLEILELIVSLVFSQLAHGARPDATESNGQSGVQYALGRPQIVWLFEEQLRNSRAGKGKVSYSFPFVISLNFARSN